MYTLFDYSRARIYFRKQSKNFFASERWRSEVMAAKALLTTHFEGLETITFHLPTKRIMALSADEKLLLLYTLILCITEVDTQYRYLREDLLALFQQRSVLQSERMTFLAQLAQEESRVVMDHCLEDLFPQGPLQIVRLWETKNPKYGGKTFLRYALEDLLVIEVDERKKLKPKRKVRHKGYRDHGTLASNDSKARKEAQRYFYDVERELENYKAELREKMPFLDDEDLYDSG